MAKLRAGPVDAAVAWYREERTKSPRDYVFLPWPMRILASQFIRDGRHTDAITLLELNLETNPRDGKSFELLAEAQLRAGDVLAAEESLKKTLVLDESNTYAADMLSRLRNQRRSGAGQD